MIRKDIQVFYRLNKTAIIQSNRNFFSFSKDETGNIKAFCSAELTADMLKDIISSGIVNITSYEKGNIIMASKFGYDILKMENVIVSLFEKYDL